MSSQGTDQRQASNLTKHEDDASSNLVAAVAKTHTDATKLTNSRIDKLLNILQGKTAKESWDATLIKQIEDGDLEGCWELSIQPSDWDPLIRRGLTWAQLQSFMEDQKRSPIIVGPLHLTSWPCCCSINSDRQIRIDRICFHQFKHRHTDAHIKRAFDGFRKLLCASEELHHCTVHSNSAITTCMSKNGEYLKSIIFYYLNNLDVDLWKTCLDAPNLVKLQLDGCSFADEGVEFCDWLTDRKHPIDMLTLKYSTIPAALLVSALRSTTCVKKLYIYSTTYKEADWDSLFDAIAQMQNLQSIDLDGCSRDHSKWMNQVSILMANAHLQNIYVIDPYRVLPPALDSNTKKQNTEQIHAAMKMNPHVLNLQVPSSWFDKETWKSQVKPIIFERQAMHLARGFEGVTVEDAASLIGYVVCPGRYLKLDVNTVFQFVLHNVGTFRAVWVAGGEKRGVAMEGK